MKDKERIIRSAYYEAQSPVRVYKLYSCTAEVIECEHGIALRSYNTIVSWYDFNECELVHFDYYSNTTCQHMSKFLRWLKSEGYEVDNVYRLWNTRYPFADSIETDASRTFKKSLFDEISKEGFYRWIHHIGAGYHPIVTLENVRLYGWNL